MPAATSSISAATDFGKGTCTLRAVQIKTLGQPTEGLHLPDLPEPPGPAAGEVLVGVEYAPINMNDLYLIQGVSLVHHSLPSVVGNEGAGRILAIGDRSVGANGWLCLLRVI